MIIKTKCDCCSKEYEYKHGTWSFKRAKYHYCSNECKKKGNNERSIIERNCVICGMNFKIYKSEIKRSYKHGKCCSESCANKNRNTTHGMSKTTEYMIYSCAKQRAKKQGVPFDIELSDIIIPDKCPLLEINIKSSKGSPTHNSPSLDKIIPKLGYVKGNIWVVSHRANWLKNDASVEEIELLLKNLKNKTP